MLRPEIKHFLNGFITNRCAVEKLVFLPHIYTGTAETALFLFIPLYNPFLFFPFFPVLWAVKPQQPLVAVDHPAARSTTPVKGAFRRRSLP